MKIQQPWTKIRVHVRLPWRTVLTHRPILLGRGRWLSQRQLHYWMPDVQTQCSRVKFTPGIVIKYFQIFHNYLVPEYILYNFLKFGWDPFMNNFTAASDRYFLVTFTHRFDRFVRSFRVDAEVFPWASVEDSRLYAPLTIQVSIVWKECSNLTRYAPCPQLIRRPIYTRRLDFG